MRTVSTPALNSIALVIFIIIGNITIIGEEYTLGYVVRSYALITFFTVAETLSMPSEQSIRAPLFLITVISENVS